MLSRNARIFGLFRLPEKISNYENMDVLLIILKYLTWIFGMHYLFQFRDFIDNNIFRKNHKSVHKITKYVYLKRLEIPMILTNPFSEEGTLGASI